MWAKIQTRIIEYIIHLLCPLISARKLRSSLRAQSARGFHFPLCIINYRCLLSLEKEIGLRVELLFGWITHESRLNSIFCLLTFAVHCARFLFTSFADNVYLTVCATVPHAFCSYDEDIDAHQKYLFLHCQTAKMLAFGSLSVWFAKNNR